MQNRYRAGKEWRRRGTILGIPFTPRGKDAGVCVYVWGIEAYRRDSATARRLSSDVFRDAVNCWTFL